MGTRKNRKNRNRKTKRKLIKGDPVTFLKSLKTPEQIRKHSLFKKRTVKRNMRGGGQRQTRKENIKKLIQTINAKYKDKTGWNLKNIEEEYKKANIKPNFFKNTYINTYGQKTSTGESISDRLSICSKWNNERIKNEQFIGKSGPYLSGKNIVEGNLSAKEALACAYWSYHTTKDSKNKNPRRLSLDKNRQTDTADGVYFPPSFLRAAGYQYRGFNINDKNATLKAFEKKSEEEKKSAAELAAKAKLEAEKNAAIAADCEEIIYNKGQLEVRQKYCIGHLIKGLDVTERIKAPPRGEIPAAVQVEDKYGLILGHLNFRKPNKDKGENWSSPNLSNFPELYSYNRNSNSKLQTFVNQAGQSNTNLYIVLFLNKNKGTGKVNLDVGILTRATRIKNDNEISKHLDIWNNMMKSYIQDNITDTNLKNSLKSQVNTKYIDMLMGKKFNMKLLDLIKDRIIKKYNLPKKFGNKNKGKGTSIWKDYMIRVYEEGDEKFNEYLNDDGYEISPVYILLQK